jgi:RNA-directed DNA polymerase
MASRAWREFAKHDWWLYWRLKSWLGKKHGKASGTTLRRLYAESRADKFWEATNTLASL